MSGQVAGVAVPTWMFGDPGPVRAAGQECSDAADALDALARDLAGLLEDAATSLGWRGSASAAASTTAAASSSQVRQAASELRDAGTALGRLATEMEREGTQIQALAERVPYVTPTDLDPTPMDRISRQVESHTESLRTAARTAGRAIADAASTLQRLASLGREGGWLATAAVPAVLDALSAAGVVDDAAELDVLARAGALPAGSAGAAALRELLSELDPQRLADLLLRHPDLAQRLVGRDPHLLDGAPAGSAGAILAAALRAAAGQDDAQGVETIRAAFAAMDPADRRRLALLYPGVVGTLDGAPLGDRTAANRVAIAAALDDEQRAQVDRERAVAALSGWDSFWNDANALDTVIQSDDTTSRAVDHSQRISYYEELLHGTEGNPAYQPGTGAPERVGHQVLYFDPRGDGLIAEMWGTIDDRTDHVAVFVPGTGTDMSNVAGTSDRARLMAAADRTGGTAVIAWAAVDLPDDLDDARDPRYAREGAPALTRFVIGLGVPPTADTTAVGHSYGGALVGQADHLGLPVDRVVLVEPAGAGPDVQDAGDYAPGRDVTRYTMTAPADAIGLVQGVLDLGADPAGIEGTTSLETGRLHDVPGDPGQYIDGATASHTDVLTAHSTAWNNIVGVIEDRRVTLQTQLVPGPYGTVSSRYEVPDYHAPTVAVPTPSR